MVYIEKINLKDKIIILFVIDKSLKNRIKLNHHVKNLLKTKKHHTNQKKKKFLKIERVERKKRRKIIQIDKIKFQRIIAISLYGNCRNIFPTIGPNTPAIKNANPIDISNVRLLGRNHFPTKMREIPKQTAMT